MSDTAGQSTEKKKAKSLFSSLAWWNIEQEEIDKQLAGYESLRVWQSVRGLSALLCAFSVGVTILLGSSMNLSGDAIATEAGIWSILGIFMYRGHRWAFVVGMVLWTFEKAAMAFGGSNGAAPIVQVIWWAIYMNAFFMGFIVEKRRAALAALPPVAAP